MTCRYFGISRQAYYIWCRRYQAEGIDDLRTRSKRPKTSPNATHVEIVGKIIHVRKNYHFGPEKIAMYLKRYHDITSKSGVWRILKRLAFTWLEGIPLSSYCRRRGLLYCTVLRRRQRAENALYQALQRGELSRDL